MSLPVPDDAPEHLREYEVPYRRVDHQHGDEDYWAPEEIFPGQFPIGTAKLDLYPWTPTAADRARWRREDHDRDARRVRLGFRAEPLP